MNEIPNASFLKRHTPEIAVTAAGAAAASLAAWAIVRHHNEKAAPDLDHLAEEYASKAAILNETRLTVERRRRLNRLAGLLVLHRSLTTADMLAKTPSSRHHLSLSLGYLRDNQLVAWVTPTRQKQAAAGYFKPTPPLDWAAARQVEYPDLAAALNGANAAELSDL